MSGTFARRPLPYCGAGVRCSARGLTGPEWGGTIGDNRDLNTGGSGMKPKRTIKTDDPEIVIQVMDDEGPGGANHLYNVVHAWDVGDATLEGTLVRIRYQKGPVEEEGVNGIQDDDLLRIVVDRLRPSNKAGLRAKRTRWL